MIVHCILLLVACTTALDPTVAARDLITRLIPSYAGSFSLAVIPAVDGNDVMQLASGNGSVILRGSNTLALTSALNWYLNDYCNTTYDWTFFQLTMPPTLPLPPAEGTTIRVRTAKWSEYV